MLQLYSSNPLSSSSKISTRLLRGLMASALFTLLFTSVSSHTYAASKYEPQSYTAQNYAPAYNSASLISRTEAANPDNFKFIRINDRMVSNAIEPCAIGTGLIACALDKLILINGRNSEADANANYDLAQTFLFPSKAQSRTAVVVISRSGLMDDSVRAERYRISFKREGQQAVSGWQLVQYGMQYQCARGDKAGQWTVSTCP